MRAPAEELALLAPNIAGEDAELRALEARRLVRRLEHWHGLEANSPSEAELMRRLRRGAEGIARLRAEGRLLAVELAGRGALYPRWQFDLPRRELAEILGAGLRDGSAGRAPHHLPASGRGDGSPTGLSGQAAWRGRWRCCARGATLER